MNVKLYKTLPYANETTFETVKNFESVTYTKRFLNKSKYQLHVKISDLASTHQQPPLPI